MSKKRSGICGALNIEEKNGVLKFIWNYMFYSKVTLMHLQTIKYLQSILKNWFLKLKKCKYIYGN